MKTIQSYDFTALGKAEPGDIVVSQKIPHEIVAVWPYNEAAVPGLWVTIHCKDGWSITAEIRNPKVYSYDNIPPKEWDEFIALKDSGLRIEIDESMFDYWLGVIPPVKMNFTFQERNISFAFAEGDYPRTFFWREDNRIFCQNMRTLNIKSFRGQDSTRQDEILKLPKTLAQDLSESFS